MLRIFCNLCNIDGVNGWVLELELGELGHINSCTTSIGLGDLKKINIMATFHHLLVCSPCQAQPEVQPQ